MSRQRWLRIIALVAITVVVQLPLVAQYCGGTLEYVVRDKKNRLIDATAVEVIENGPAPAFASIRQANPATVENYKLKKLDRAKTDSPSSSRLAKPYTFEGLPVSTFVIRMGCRLDLLELSLKLDGEVMKLRFVNIRELDSVLDSLQFQNGTFEIDLEEVFIPYPVDKSNFDLNGLKSGEELFLPWHGKTRTLIAARNWKRVKTEH